MVRFIINAGLTLMIALILMLTPNLKMCVIGGIALLMFFVAINVIFDHDEVKSLR